MATMCYLALPGPYAIEQDRRCKYLAYLDYVEVCD